MRGPANSIDDDPLWYKHAIIYQVHIKSFKDSNADGIGDFAGLSSKLNYLESLGVTALWLLPFYPSPLKDDGYDIADYLKVHPHYGTLRDFHRLLQEAHRRGMRVITELVINHTSDQHPWFQRARRAKKGSLWRNYYIWSDTPARYSGARIIFKDFEASNWTWDPIAGAYFFHRFYSHQPDLNYDNPAVHREIFKVADFWLAMGVDGVRLDAIPYLYKREGTNCENLPETHLFLKKLRQHIDKKFKNRLLLAEANQWPEDAVQYFGEGDECHMAFHFPVMPRIYMALRMEDRFPIVDILEQTPRLPPACQWAMFLRNHDELTLEMVSDEERDYMYHMYAKDPSARLNLGIRRRLAPLLENDRRKIQLLNILLLSLPGTPIIYYGDEIGMGDNYYLGDRNGVRTPMQWSSERNGGFSSANPQKLYLPLIIDPEYHYEVINVENEERNTASLLWWMRRMLIARKKYNAFGSGSLTFISPENTKILAFIRLYEEVTILVVINLSRFSQATELDLSNYRGCTPLEIFHHNPFPPIRDAPYNITLGPYGHFWLALKDSERLASQQPKSGPVKIPLTGSWESILREPARSLLEQKALPHFLIGCSWFKKRHGPIQKVQIVQAIPIRNCWLLFIEVTFQEQWTDTYLVPVAFTWVEEDGSCSIEAERSALAILDIEGREGFLFDAVHDHSFQSHLLAFFQRKRHHYDANGELLSFPSKSLKPMATKLSTTTSLTYQGDLTSTVIQYGQDLWLKLYRYLDEGLNPDVAMTQFLSEKCHLHTIPPYRGKMLWRNSRGLEMAIALIQGYVPGRNGREYTWDTLTHYFEQIVSRHDELEHELKNAADEHSFMEDLIGSYLESISILAHHTAEMHITLYENSEDPEFKAEPLGMLYQRSTYQTLRVMLRRVFASMQKKLPTFSAAIQEQLHPFFLLENDILSLFQKLLNNKIQGLRIRIHGDYRLGKVIFCGKDIFITDFDGDIQRSLATRHAKHPPQQDVASMLYSFQCIASQHLLSGQILQHEMSEKLAIWATRWHQCVGRIFKHAYTEYLRPKAPSLLLQPSSEEETLLHVWIAEKALSSINNALQGPLDDALVPIKILRNILSKYQS